MTLFDIAALLIGLSALFAYLNRRIMRLPNAIGIVVIALAASLSLLALDVVVPRFSLDDTLRSALLRIDFYAAVMEGMLSFLLFAGAVHVSFDELARRKWSIGALASIGVLISTGLIGAAIWLVSGLLGWQIPFAWALVFGALISPTDPVAVLGILKTVNVPHELEAKIAGESLFNDGVGVVVFAILVAIAAGGAEADIGAGEVVALFMLEAFGGALLGFAAGYIAYRAMRGIDEHNTEVLITLALVTVTYSIALHLHISGPIAVVVAGLFIGNHGARFAMSERTRQHVFQFWELTDELLNSVLFLLIGLEVLVVGAGFEHMGLALLAIPIALVARLIAVSVPIQLLSLKATFTEGAIWVLTWGGLRGGISVALVLSLPDNAFKPTLMTMTFFVVIFSIIVQGLTMKRLVRRVVRQEIQTRS